MVILTRLDNSAKYKMESENIMQIRIGYGTVSTYMYLRAAVYFTISLPVGSFQKCFTPFLLEIYSHGQIFSLNISHKKTRFHLIKSHYQNW